MDSEERWSAQDALAQTILVFGLEELHSDAEVLKQSRLSAVLVVKTALESLSLSAPTD